MDLVLVVCLCMCVWSIHASMFLSVPDCFGYFSSILSINIKRFPSFCHFLFQDYFGCVSALLSVFPFLQSITWNYICLLACFFVILWHTQKSLNNVYETLYVLYLFYNSHRRKTANADSSKWALEQWGIALVLLFQVFVLVPVLSSYVC